MMITRTKHTDGFHLIECLIVLTLFCILTDIGYSTYQQHIAATYRKEAVKTLTELTGAMEIYAIEHNGYKGADLSSLHHASEPLPTRYQINISTSDHDYLISAAPIGSQLKYDTSCGTLSINALGLMTISGNRSPKDCW